MSPESNLLAPPGHRNPKTKHAPADVVARHAVKSSEVVAPAAEPVFGAKAKGYWDKGVDWIVAGWIIATHIGALSAFFFFTWKAVALAAALSFVTGCLGVCLGYHRLLTHGSLTTYRPIRWLFAFLGGLSGEGSALVWVANHRKHHLHSDQDGDPHTPRDGAFWSHMLWFMPNFGRKHYDDLVDKYAPDLMRDPVFRALDLLFLPIHIATGLLLYGVGAYYWDTYTGASFVAWGMFVRLMYVQHVTWFVNSATHLWGYRNYKTTDNSRNLWWVGLLAFGEGWHNNHHAFQRMARHGHKWWELDITYLMIRGMEKCGLCWNVVHDVPARQRALAEQEAASN